MFEELRAAQRAMRTAVAAANPDGPTSLDNCLRRCRYHHHLCTHHGWRFERRPDGRWQFLAPESDDRSPPDRAPPHNLQLAI